VAPHDDAEDTMKTPTAAAATVLFLALSGCATTPGPNGFTRSRMDQDIDLGKVIAVNEWAVRRHASVVWVNYPKKPARLRNDEG
jgi:hypothetical protein